MKAMCILFTLICTVSCTWGTQLFKSSSDAKRYYEPLAEAGDATAQLEMGRLCLTKSEFDIEEAMYWYGLAAQQGNEHGQEQYHALSNDWPLTRGTKYWLSQFGLEPNETNCCYAWLLAIICFPLFPIWLFFVLAGMFCA